MEAPEFAAEDFVVFGVLHHFCLLDIFFYHSVTALLQLPVKQKFLIERDRLF